MKQRDIKLLDRVSVGCPECTLASEEEADSMNDGTHGPSVAASVI